MFYPNNSSDAKPFTEETKVKTNCKGNAIYPFLCTRVNGPPTFHSPAALTLMQQFYPQYLQLHLEICIVYLCQ